jgi:hypothetical protein
MNCTRYPHRPKICPSRLCAESSICKTFVCDSCGRPSPTAERVVVFEGVGLTDHDDGTWRYCRSCKPGLPGQQHQTQEG